MSPTPGNAKELSSESSEILLDFQRPGDLLIVAAAVEARRRNERIIQTEFRV